MKQSSVSVLGSSGSIGTQTLDVIADSKGLYRVQSLAVKGSADVVIKQAQSIRPELVVIVDETKAAGVAKQLPAGTELLVGVEGLIEAASRSDICVNGVVGFAGLSATIAALGAGKRLALANKESLIAGGPVVSAVRSTLGAELVPVDSEHAAIHQCLRAGRASEVARLVLTASGGPFRGRSALDLANVTVEDALAHPTWKMGPKITIDSSTLMNKGLEVIEAHHLFDVDYSAIDVVVHPQSLVHSMVEFTDGSTIAQVSQPNMKLPIEYALGYPERGAVPYGAMDWTTAQTWSFEPPDLSTFGCLELAYSAGQAGHAAPAWLNAANEVAVAAFLQGQLNWPEIYAVVAETLDGYQTQKLGSVADVLAADAEARQVSQAIVNTRRSA